MDDQIRVNSDSWTGRDPARAAPKEDNRKAFRKVFYALAAVALVLLAVQIARFDEWDNPSLENLGRFVPMLLTLLQCYIALKYQLKPPSDQA